MSQHNRTTLKHYFKTGSRPTQGQFADLIDSCLNLSDSDLFEVDGSLGLGCDQPLARLSVNGNLSVSPNNDTAPDNGLFVHGKVGIGAGFSNPAAQLAVNGGVYIGAARTADPGPDGLRVDGDITSGGNLTMANDKYVAADTVRARDESGLKLTESGGKGLNIEHGSGDLVTRSNLTVHNNKYLKTGFVQALDGGGIRFQQRDGDTRIRVHNSGHVSIGTAEKSWAQLNVLGSVLVSKFIEATALKLTGGMEETDPVGSKGGKKYGDWTLDAPDGKVVCGIRLERWRSGDGDKDMYRIALRYR